MKNLFLFMFFLLAFPVSFAGVIEVVSSATVLREIIVDIGGDKVSVQNIGPHDQSFHFVIVRPSHVSMLARADLFVHLGVQGEPWVPDLVESSGNRNIFPGQPGNLDVSRGIEILDKPTSVSREHGHIHPMGNSHYWLDPVNIIKIGLNVRDKLTELAPGQESFFESNYQRFSQEWMSLIRDWVRRMQKVGELRVIEYHDSWLYLYKRFGMKKLGSLEPQPGIKPSGAHIARILQTGKQQKVNFLIAEPFYPPRDIDMVVRNLSIPKLIIAQTPGGDYPNMRDIIEKIVVFCEGLKNN